MFVGGDGVDGGLNPEASIALHKGMITKREMFEKSPFFANNFAILLSFLS